MRKRFNELSADLEYWDDQFTRELNTDEECHEALRKVAYDFKDLAEDLIALETELYISYLKDMIGGGKYVLPLEEYLRHSQKCSKHLKYELYISYLKAMIGDEDHVLSFEEYLSQKSSSGQ